jgi:LuxR family maltose regulon positive regulatory protein
LAESATTLLATKLFVPRTRPNLVSRPRLLEQLGKALNCGLVLVSAPAGFGKTTLVSEWVAGCKRPVAWLSLDEGDNSPTCFLTYLIAALQKVAPKIGDGLLGALQSPQPPPTESILTTLLNEITAVPDDFVLVLDDYHLVDAKPVDNTMTFLLEHLPPQMHLVIATREDPSLPLARLRVRGQLIELRAADLRFSPAEAADFLNQVMGLSLASEDIASLETRTEGWIAGLQLAALSIQGREDIASFIHAFTGSHRFVLDYLVEEVLQHQSEHIRNFLLQTSILDRFCAPLCNAVTDREDGKEMLDVLERSNLFIIPLDDQRQWYRYHHLFAEVLQAHLREAQPDRVSTLHGRASKWYEHNGSMDKAIRHAFAAEDFERAAGLIEMSWPTIEDGALSTKWLGWLKALPDELFRSRPVLSVWYAYALLVSGEMEAADARLTDAERWLEPADNVNKRLKNPADEMVVVDEEQFRSLPATIALGRAYHAQILGDMPGAVTYARRVLDLTPEENSLTRGQATALLGFTYWASGDLEAANRTIAGYTMMLRTAGNILDAISTTSVLADIQMGLGRLNKAVSTLDQFLQFVVDLGKPIPPDTAELYRGLGEISLEQGDLEAAAQHLHRSKLLGEKAELPVWPYRWCTAQARLNKAKGDLDGALALLDEAERLHIRSPLPDFCPISALKARIWVAQGRLTKALEWVHEDGLSPESDICYLREFGHITLARILIAQYQNDRMDGSIPAVMGLLDRLLKAAEEGNRIGSVIEILVLQAIAHQAQGNIAPALVSLERALTLAEPEGYVRIFVDEGKRMAELMTRIEPMDGTLRAKQHILRLRSALDIHKEISPSSSNLNSSPMGNNRSSLLAHQSVNPQPLVEPLSERELEVLRLLRTDLSGPGIARECMVSVSTVRTHTQNIYAKLGVNTRRAAVRRAEELDLL